MKTFIAAMLTGVALTLFMLVVLDIDFAKTTNRFTAPNEPAADHQATDNAETKLSDLLAMSAEQLDRVDLATLNLACAKGLPNADALDAKKCLATLDNWADSVRQKTQEVFLLAAPISGGQIAQQEAQGRVKILADVLRENFLSSRPSSSSASAEHAARKKRRINFKDPSSVFIHGLLTAKSEGTGVSSPVVHAAVARRLGYPLRLAMAKNHIFLRWDDQDAKVAFNVEITPRGVAFPPDEYYHKWPATLSPMELASGRFLRALTASEELAAFMAMRGHCLLDNNRTSEAMEAYASAHRLAPKEGAYAAWLNEAMKREMGSTALAARGKGGRDASRASAKPAARDPLAELKRIEALNAQSRRAMGIPALPDPRGSRHNPGAREPNLPGYQPPRPR